MSTPDVLVADRAQVSAEISGSHNPVSEQLRDILAQYPDVVPQGYTITEVGGLGLVIHLTPPNPGREWVVFDLDDTTVAYSSAKDTRRSGYRAFVAAHGFDIDEATQKQLIDEVTDEFSRWSEGGTEQYHVQAHIAGLAIATGRLSHCVPEQREQTIEDLKREFAGLKARVAGSGLPVPVPVELQKQYEDLTALFQRTMIELPAYEDTVKAMRTLDTGVQPKPNQVFCTRGEPTFQLPKTLSRLREQLQKGEPINISEIWLTTSFKGPFLKELAAQGHEAFGLDPHALIVVDDNGREVSSVIAARRQMHIGSAIVDGLHLRRRGIKAEWQEVWSARNPGEGHIYYWAEGAHGGIGLAPIICEALARKLWLMLQSEDLPAEAKQELEARRQQYRQFAAEARKHAVPPYEGRHRPCADR